MTLLADLDAARGADLTVLDDDGLEALASRIARGRRCLAALATAVAGEADRRQASGSSPSPEDLSDPDGDQSQRARAKDSARGEIRKDLPDTGRETESGETKTENADYLASCLGRLSDSEKQRLAGHDRRIADQARALRPEAFRTWLAKLLITIADPPNDDDELSPSERAMAAAAFAMFRRPDGTWGIAGTMDGERGTHLDAVIGARARRIANRRPPGERAITANDRAAAVFELICSVDLTSRPSRSNGSGGPGRSGAPDGRGQSGGPKGSRSGNADGLFGPGGPGADTLWTRAGDRGHGGVDLVRGPNLSVGVIVDAATLINGAHERTVAETWDGHPIAPGVAQRLACDADLYAILYDQLGRPVTVGCTRRAATRHQRLQLRGLYPTCPIDEVTPFSACHIHHVNVSFEDDGPTDLHNLVPVSTRWHHRIHDRGWQLTMDADRTLHLHRPDGTHDRTIPPPIPITRHGP